MIQPKVSVIIPVYNTSQYLYDAVGSVVRQTLQEIEIICVDDGSTDNSLEILKQMANDDNRMVVIHQENQGQSVARNTAMKYAHGKYIYFMDSDDIIVLDALFQCYEYCENLLLDFCFFDGDVMLEDGAHNLSWDYHRTSNYSESTIYKGVELFERMLDTNTHRAVPWLWLVRKEYIDRIGIFFYPGIIHEDELYSVLLFLQAEKIGCLKKSFVCHRVRATSTMGKKYSIRNVNCYFTVIDELHKFAMKNVQHKALIKKYSQYTLNAVFTTAFVLSFSEKIKAYHRLIASGYIKYVDFMVLLKFWLKQ